MNKNIEFQLFFHQLERKDKVDFLLKNESMVTDALFLYNRKHKNQLKNCLAQVKKRLKRYRKATIVATLDTLPDALIGQIASFFDQKEYGCFLKVNRRTYLASSQPIQLRQLTIGWGSSKFSSSPAFKFVKFLELNPLFIKTLKPSFKSLSKLKLHFPTHENHTRHELLLQRIGASKKFKQENITQLYLNSMVNETEPFFSKIMHNFPKLRKLSLVDCTIHGNQKTLKNATPNVDFLQLLMFVNDKYTAQEQGITNILEAFSGNLKCLIFESEYEYDLPAYLSFENLEKLEITLRWNSDYDLLQHIASSAKKLETVHLDIMNLTTENKDSLLIFMKKCTSLRKIQFNDIAHFNKRLEPIIEIINKAFLSMEDKCKTSLEITLPFSRKSTDDETTRLALLPISNIQSVARIAEKWCLYLKNVEITQDRHKKLLECLRGNPEKIRAVKQNGLVLHSDNFKEPRTNTCLFEEFFPDW